MFLCLVSLVDYQAVEILVIKVNLKECKLTRIKTRFDIAVYSCEGIPERFLGVCFFACLVLF